jgi:metal-dependent amidase/aminoacylase/carboxypeptidase family protein
MRVINRVADLSDEIATWRRDSHENPELLYDVHGTAGIVADKLEASAATRSRAASAAPGSSA